MKCSNIPLQFLQAREKQPYHHHQGQTNLDGSSQRSRKIIEKHSTLRVRSSSALMINLTVTLSSTPS